MKKLIALSTIVGTLLVSGAPAMAATSNVTANIVGVSETEGGLQITSAPDFSFEYQLGSEETVNTTSDTLVVSDLRAAENRDAFSVNVSMDDVTVFNGAKFTLAAGENSAVISDANTSVNVDYAANDTLLSKNEVITAEMDFTNLDTADDIVGTIVWSLDSGSTEIVE